MTDLPEEDGFADAGTPGQQAHVPAAGAACSQQVCQEGCRAEAHKKPDVGWGRVLGGLAVGGPLLHEVGSEGLPDARAHTV